MLCTSVASRYGSILRYHSIYVPAHSAHACPVGAFIVSHLPIHSRLQGAPAVIAEKGVHRVLPRPISQGQGNGDPIPANCTRQFLNRTKASGATATFPLPVNIAPVTLLLPTLNSSSCSHPSHSQASLLYSSYLVASPARNSPAHVKPDWT
jgi:hypothetical protein